MVLAFDGAKELCFVFLRCSAPWWTELGWVRWFLWSILETTTVSSFLIENLFRGSRCVFLVGSSCQTFVTVTSYSFASPAYIILKDEEVFLDLTVHVTVGRSELAPPPLFP